MYNFKHREASGRIASCFFYEKWSEVPFDAFIKWQRLVSELQAVESDLNEQSKRANELRTEYERLYFSENKEQANSVLAKAERVRARYEEIKRDEYFPLQVEAIACFTDVPVSELMLKSTAIPDGYEDDLSHYKIDAENILFYKNLLYLLSRQPLPGARISSFEWQTEPDAVIEQLQSEYSKLSLFAKFGARGRELRARLKRAKKGTYNAVNIWEQSTYANKHFKDVATDICERLERDDWSGLPGLISMLFVESKQRDNILNEIRDEKHGSAYLEKYALAFKHMFDNNQSLFFSQKRKLTVDKVLGLRSFFLHN
jgi:hypothetical protein